MHVTVIIRSMVIELEFLVSETVRQINENLTLNSNKEEMIRQLRNG